MLILTANLDAVFLAAAILHIKVAELIPSLGMAAGAKKMKIFVTTSMILYTALMYSTKIAVALFHLELTAGFWIHKAARWTLWLLIIAWPLQHVIFFMACPFHHRYAIDPKPGCPPPRHAWDFWVIYSIHMSTDILLFIIPFPALVKIRDLKLRLIICGVYALGISFTAISCVRVVLLVVHPDKDILRVMTLSIIEESAHVVVAAIPWISGIFIQKYYIEGGYVSTKGVVKTERRGMSIKTRSWTRGESGTSAEAEAGRGVAARTGRKGLAESWRRWLNCILSLKRNGVGSNEQEGGGGGAKDINIRVRRGMTLDFELVEKESMEGPSGSVRSTEHILHMREG
ncbi:hypothetical protein MKZ38_007542 [Zalerion maritima]|uniref:Rhodopsin domain-containing protein n=1 Tax=Zalerion maritima TaxID=339359 RepID=A0AAD5WP45_9PEZI|nr:hypothetical protein MKZ38_007542 [Zalerion maritima]